MVKTLLASHLAYICNYTRRELSPLADYPFPPQAMDTSYIHDAQVT